MTLTVTEFLILQALAQRPGVVDVHARTRPTTIRSTWTITIVDSYRSSGLRKKFKSTIHSRMIETLPRSATGSRR